MIPKNPLLYQGSSPDREAGWKVSSIYIWPASPVSLEDWYLRSRIVLEKHPHQAVINKKSTSVDKLFICMKL